jgi:predicted RNA-binding Zn ribbon-like protein
MVLSDRGSDREGLTDETLLMAIANTGHDEADELADSGTIAAWWAELTEDDPTTVLEPGSSSQARGAERLRALRDVIRRLAWANNGVHLEADPAAEAVLATMALRPDLNGLRMSVRAGRNAALTDTIDATAIAALIRAPARPTWPRFKACHALDCGWVFIDASRNLSRRWCDMNDCGNRAKGAAFRARARRS